jgi:hypothetical protein
MASHEGGCHCGAVRIRVHSDEREIIDCNCSMCRKKGFLHFIVAADELEILRGEEALSEYRFGTRSARHLFCMHCGIHPFYVPRSHPDGYSVNLRCLDDFEELLPRFERVLFDGSQWDENIHRIR